MSEPGAWADLDDEQPADAAAEPTTYYTNVDEFFRHFLRPVYRRPINARTTFWAADWWRYPEAVLRLDAMGAPGNKPASTPPPAWPPGSATSPTTT